MPHRLKRNRGDRELIDSFAHPAKRGEIQDALDNDNCETNWRQIDCDASRQFSSSNFDEEACGIDDDVSDSEISRTSTVTSGKRLRWSRGDKDDNDMKADLMTYCLQNKEWVARYNKTSAIFFRESSLFLNTKPAFGGRAKGDGLQKKFNDLVREVMARQGSSALLKEYWQLVVVDIITESKKWIEAEERKKKPANLMGLTALGVDFSLPEIAQTILSDSTISESLNVSYHPPSFLEPAQHEVEWRHKSIHTQPPVNMSAHGSTKQITTGSIGPLSRELLENCRVVVADKMLAIGVVTMGDLILHCEFTLSDTKSFISTTGFCLTKQSRKILPSFEESLLMPAPISHLTQILGVTRCAATELYDMLHPIYREILRSHKFDPRFDEDFTAFVP